MRRITLVGTVALVLLASGWPSTAGNKRERLAASLCDALHALPAGRKSECCGTPIASLAEACARELSAALRRKAVTLDTAGIERCADETSRKLEGCGWVTALVPSPADACQGLIHGNLAARAACRSSLECVDGLYCRGVTPGEAGVCAVPVPPRTRCERPADNLAVFTRSQDDPRHPSCEGACGAGQCLPFARKDEACSSSAPCAPGLQCIGEHCRDLPLPEVGESCADGTSCAAGAYCGAGRCAQLKSAGEPCKLPFECRAFECATVPGAEAGTCSDPCGSAAGTASVERPSQH